MTATPGTWKPGASVRFQWLADGAAIPGATDATYTPGAEVLGRNVAVKVVATKKSFAPIERHAADLGAGRQGRLQRGRDPRRHRRSDRQPDPHRDAGGVVAGAERVRDPLAGRQPDDRGRVRSEPDPHQGTGRQGDHRGRRGLARRIHEGHQEVGAPRSGDARQDRRHRAVPCGRPQPGGRADVDRAGRVHAEDAQVSYTWLRDGVPIAGATASSYSVVPADAGSRMSAKVTLTSRSTRPGW